MNFRACVQPPLDVNGIDSSIDTKMLKTPHDLLVEFTALENGRKPYIGTLKKDRGKTFLEGCAGIFKAKFLCYVNEVLFEMVKNPLRMHIWEE